MNPIEPNDPQDDEEDLSQLKLFLEQHRTTGCTLTSEVVQDILYHLYSLSSRNIQLHRELSVRGT